MFERKDFERLGRLMDSLYICSGIKFALIDNHSHQIYTSNSKTDFCQMIEDMPEGYARCMQCDKLALTDINQRRHGKLYRCHLGLIEVALPVLDSGDVAVTVLFGQLLDASSRDEQWVETRARLRSWHPEPDALKNAFYRLKRLSERQIAAYQDIVYACVSEVRLAGVVAAGKRNDAQRLQHYIETHYTKDVTVQMACESLRMSKTTLYALCHTQFQTSFAKLFARRRMDEAKELLLYTHSTIQFIAEAVGVPDANYFAKIFKKYTGLTPGKYRKITAVKAVDNDRSSLRPNEETYAALSVSNDNKAIQEGMV